MVKPKLIISDQAVIDTIAESLKDANHQSIIYTFGDARDTIKSVNELVQGYDTNPSEFM